MQHKLSPRPISPSDEIDKSRDMIGFNKWARSSRTISFIMLLLGWFTIPAEVFLRRDFGQRWFTAINYYAGLFLLLIFSVVQYLLNLLWEGLQSLANSIASALNPNYQAPEPDAPSLMDKSMRYFLLLYLLLGAYQLFKIWWRSRTYTALHSFDDGTSRLEPLGRRIIAPLNKVGTPLISLIMKLLPKKQRIVTTPPAFFTDAHAFSNTVLEPLLLLIVAIWLNGIASLWMFMTAIAVAIHANWKETARLQKLLDFRDSVFEAQAMGQLKEGLEQPNAAGRIVQQAVSAIKAHPEVVPEVSHRYSNLMGIIDEMNKDGSHLGN